MAIGFDYSDSICSKHSVFSKAKKEACAIFTEFEDCLKNVDTVFKDIHNGAETQERGDILDKEDYKPYEEKVRRIHEILKRDYMKIVFLGRTSNGKSTVINAMLHGKILPSGMGQTTNVFIEVKGSKDEKITVKQHGSSESKNVEQSDLLEEISKLNKQEQNVIEVSWPCKKCELLKEDIRLVDCPGYNDSSTVDEQLNTVCQDADIFVLVISAVSSLSDQDKKYFHDVSTRISKPNIFVLFNWWDIASAQEPEHENDVRQHHTNRAMDLLTKELPVMEETEMKKRIFFVSAREMLDKRMGKYTEEGGFEFETRRKEFEAFEDKVKTCMSETAVKTKFKAHFDSGKAIISKLRADLEEFESKVQEEFKKLDNDEQILCDIDAEIQTKLDEVETIVISSVEKQISALDKLVINFHNQFDPKNFEDYKNELNTFVTKEMDEDVQIETEKYIEEIRQIEETKMQGLSNLCQRQSEELMKESPHLMSVAAFVKDFRANVNVGLSLRKLNIFKVLPSFLIAPLKHLAPRLPVASLGPALPSLTVAGLTISAGTLMMAGSVAAATAAAGMGLVAVRSAVTNWTVDEKETSFKEQYVDHLKKQREEFVKKSTSGLVQQIQTSKTLEKFKTEAAFIRTKLNQDLTELGNLRTKLNALDEKLSKFIETFLTK